MAETKMKKSKGNFRKAMTSSGKIMLAGKDAEQNELVIGQAGEDEIVVHTKRPGSPFVNIKADAADVSRDDVKEAAIFCVKFSQAWKKAKTKPERVDVHVFLGKDIYKRKGMAVGTFGVRKFRTVVVKKDEIAN